MTKTMLAAVLTLTMGTAAVLAQDKTLGPAQNDIMDASNFGRMVMIATLNQVGGGKVTKGKEEKVNLPMTVSLSEKNSGGTSIQCVQICTVIGGVPICVCI
jgi:hypothetical protein